MEDEDIDELIEEDAPSEDAPSEVYEKQALRDIDTLAPEARAFVFAQLAVAASTKEAATWIVEALEAVEEGMIGDEDEDDEED